ncbi:MAG TPA: SulP family inorganic anion transporter [Chloroflexota bacterium]|nr:SulP family inorganic anion transporter [Chloroflexota bacterium]
MMIQEWPRMWQREFANYNRDKLQRDVLAGITVAAVSLPLALAFGVASGADAAAGLVTAVLAGLVIGLLGGAPYQISGPTGAMSAVLIVLVSRYGLQGMWLAAVLAGIMLTLLGIFRLGRVVALIPAPVISGFTSGIAIIIALGQIDNFLGIKTPPAENVIEKLRYYTEHDITPNPEAMLLALLVMAIMIIWPRFKFGQRLPGSLVGIIVATLIVVVAHWEVPVIGSIPRTILLENRLTLDQIPWADLSNLIIPAMSIAALGAIESLLCGAVAGNMTGIRLNNNMELVAQGVGNIVIPLFGGVPATAAIARTSVNIKSGGVTRVVPMLHGILLLLAALLLAGIIGQVPLAALAGVLLVTAWRMNEWHTIRFYVDHRLKHALIAFFITLVATVVLDLTQAILIGFGISTLIFMAQMSELQISRKPVEVERLTAVGQQFVHPGQNIAVYYLSGPLFFAAARRLVEFVESQDTPDTTLILSIRGVPLIDATGVEVLREIVHRQRHGGGDVLLTSMDDRVRLLLERAGILAELGPDHIFWSADKAIAALGATVRSEPAVETTEQPIMESLLLAPFAEKMEVNRQATDPLDRTVAGVMRTEVVTVSPDASAADIVALLLQKGYRSLPVVAENGRLLGIITDGDLLRRANLSTRLAPSGDDWSQRLAEVADQAITAASLMTAPVVTIPAAAALRQAMQQMITHNLKRLPVVDGGRLVGWISRVDILRAIAQHQSLDEPLTYETGNTPVDRHAITIADLMYRDVPVVSPQATLEEVLQALEQDRRRRAVVVDADGKVSGIITDGDLLQRSQHASHPGLRGRLHYLGTGQSSASASVVATTETAAALMTTPVITVPVDATPNEALRLIMQHGVKRLPVVDENGRLVGLLDRARLLQGLLAD